MMNDDKLRAGAMRQQQLLRKLQREQHDRILRDVRHIHHRTRRRHPSPRGLAPLPAQVVDRSRSAMDVLRSDGDEDAEGATRPPLPTSMTPAPSSTQQLRRPVQAAAPLLMQRLGNAIAHEGGCRTAVEHDEKSERAMLQSAWRLLTVAASRAAARARAHAELARLVSQLWREEVKARVLVYRQYIKRTTALYTDAFAHRAQALADDELHARRFLWGLFCRSYSYSSRGAATRLLEQDRERLGLALECAKAAAAIRRDQWAARVQLYDDMERLFRKIRVRWAVFVSARPLAEQSAGVFVMSPSAISASQRADEAHQRAQAAERRKLTTLALSAVKCITAQESIVWQLLLRWRRHGIDEANLKARMWRMEQTHKSTMLERPQVVLLSPLPSPAAPSICFVHDLCRDARQAKATDVLSTSASLITPGRRDVDADEDDQLDPPGLSDSSLVVDGRVELGVAMDDTWVARAYISWITSEFRVKRTMANETEQRTAAAAGEADIAVKKLRIAAKAFFGEIRQLPEGSAVAELLSDVPPMFATGLVSGLWDLFTPDNAGMVAVGTDAVDSLESSLTSGLRSAKSFVRGAKPGQAKPKPQDDPLKDAAGDPQLLDELDEGDIVGKSTPQSGVARLTAIDEAARLALERLKDAKEVVGAATMRVSLSAQSAGALKLMLFVDPAEVAAITALRGADPEHQQITIAPGNTSVVVRCPRRARLDVLQDIARAVRITCDQACADAVACCPPGGAVVDVLVELEAETWSFDSLWLPGCDLYAFQAKCATQSMAESPSIASVKCSGSVSVSCVILPPTFPPLGQPLPAFDCRHMSAMPLSHVLRLPPVLFPKPVCSEVPTSVIGRSTTRVALGPPAAVLEHPARFEASAYDGSVLGDTFVLVDRHLRSKGLESVKAVVTPRPDGGSGTATRQAFQVLVQSSMRHCATVELEEGSVLVEAAKDGLSLGHLMAIFEAIHFSTAPALGSAGVRAFEAVISAPMLPPLRFFFGFSVQCPRLTTSIQIKREVVFRSPLTAKALAGNEDLVPPRPQLIDATSTVSNSDKSNVTGATIAVELVEGLLPGDYLDVAPGPDADGTNDVELVLTKPLPPPTADTLGDYEEELRLSVDGTAIAKVVVFYVTEIRGKAAPSPLAKLGTAGGSSAQRQSSWIGRHPSFASLSVRRASTVSQNLLAEPPQDDSKTDENGEPVPLRSSFRPQASEADGSWPFVASRKVVVTFLDDVPFTMLQRVLRAVTYCHSPLAFPNSSARISITVNEGVSRSHVDAHGNIVAYETDAASSLPTTHVVSLVRASSFLVPEARASTYSGLAQYNENSGRKQVFPRFEEFRDAVLHSFVAGGYIRVEIAGDDVDDDDQLFLDIPETRLKRHRYLASDIAKLLPNAIVSQTAEARRRTSLSASMGASVNAAALPSVFDAPTVAEAYDAAAAMTARRRMTRSRRSTSSLLQPRHSSRVSRSVSMSVSSPAPSPIEALAEIAQSINFSLDASASIIRKDALSSPMSSSVTPPSAPLGRRLWGVVRATVSATRTIRHFGLGLKSAASMVQQRHTLELSAFGLDQSFVRPGMPLEAYKLTDATTNAMQGVLFSTPTCLVVSFATGGANVAAGTVLELIHSIKYENTNRAPTILNKRILLSVAHSQGGECYHLQRTKIIPFDDPTEITMEWPALSYRIGTTEVEPYTLSSAQRILKLRESCGPSNKFPESHVLGPSHCCCAPRVDALLLFAPWHTTVFDPDTDHWDGGSVSIIATRGTYNNRGFIGLLSEEGQEVLRSQLAPRFHCIIPQYTLHLEEPEGGIGPTRLLFSSPVHGSRVLLGILTTPMTPFQLADPPGKAGKQQAAAKQAPVAENQNILVLNIAFEPSHLDRWITVDILTYIVNCLTFAAFAGAGPEDAAAAGKPLTKHYRIEVRDADNPLCGLADFTVECLPRMLTMQPHNPAVAALVAGAAASIGCSDPSSVLPYSLAENATNTLGEVLLLRASIGVQDKDKISGGFIEVCSVSNWHQKDAFVINFGQSGITCSADGLLKAKEGVLGRMYQAQGYVRIDLAGYPFEGRKGGRSLDVEQVAECISPRRAAEQMHQPKRPSILGKRFVQLLQAIRFSVTDPKDPTVLGPRNLSVTLSDGRFDPCGRLEASSIPMIILVGK